MLSPSTPISARSLRLLAPPVLVLAVCLAVDGVGGAAAQQFPVCAAQGLAGMIVTVQDRTTRVPLPGAAIAASWRLDGNQLISLVADSAGTALICAPPDLPLTLRVTYHHVRAGPQTTTLIMARRNTHTFTVDAPGAYVRGSVLDQETGAPIADAVLTIVNSRMAVTTTVDGAFRFEQVPLGDYTVRVEHISYTTVVAPLRVRSDDLDAAFRLAQWAVPLEPLVVTTFSRRLDRVGFYEREKRGIGTFIGRVQIDAMHAQTSADLLRKVPSVRLVPRLAQRNVARMDLSGRGGCRFSFIVDGARTLEDFDMDFVAPYAIEGIEIYQGIADLPAPFRAHVTRDNTGRTCGVIAIWTRDSR
ncbi:hypothetical protein BH23GEM9_BH23GEM9_34300 [soil metagenome]